MTNASQPTVLKTPHCHARMVPETSPVTVDQATWELCAMNRWTFANHTLVTTGTVLAVSTISVAHVLWGSLEWSVIGTSTTAPVPTCVSMEGPAWMG